MPAWRLFTAYLVFAYLASILRLFLEGSSAEYATLPEMIQLAAEYSLIIPKFTLEYATFSL